MAKATGELQLEEYISQCSQFNMQRPLPPLPVYGLLGQYCSFPIEKQLTKTDLMKQNSRLSLNRNDVRRYLCPLLNTDEAEEIEQGGIHVNVYDGEGNVYEMKFQAWGGVKIYVLTSSNWIRFCCDHNLVQGVDSWITLWMFKHVDTHQLCFSVVPWSN